MILIPRPQKKFIKHIYVYGTDGNSYLFTFMKLTNGTDVEIGQYKLDNFGEWQLENIDPTKCL